jgi:hypothetical protein
MRCFVADIAHRFVREDGDEPIYIGDGAPFKGRFLRDEGTVISTRWQSVKSLTR